MEIQEMSEILIRIDERTKNIQEDLAEVGTCIHDHEERIRALEVQGARDHGGDPPRGGSPARDIGGGAAASAGGMFVLGKLLGWFRNV